jgi:stage V sporulation protein D (sporulation-specific penicillin-binding protein)
MKARGKNIRVYIIGAIFVLATLGLWTRLFQIQVLSHSHYKSEAESQSRTRQDIPAIRGAVYDRHGLPLALSVRSYSLSLHPKEVQDKRTVVSALSKASGLSRSAVKKKLSSDKSFVWVRRKCFPAEEDLKILASLKGVGVHREADRVYPHGGVGGKVVGFIGYDNKGMAGIEAAFDRELSGTAGVEEILMNGDYKSSGYVRYQIKAPQNGNDIYLTIDAVIQEIAEFELGRAVRDNKAKAGCLIVTDVATGEILALAEYPFPKKQTSSKRTKSSPESSWTLRSVSCVYEPGSTFKLITAAALLEEGTIHPSERFDAEGGKADLGCAIISDPHPHDVVTFEEAFAVSSNIAMAKAAGRLQPDQFYRRICLFGFGSKTGVHLLGESAGAIANVNDWSKRTQATLAFGQEIAATPLQMLGAFAAVANNGILMVPHIVKGIMNSETGKTRTFSPVRKRQVISMQTVRILKDFCAKVVESGTGIRAGVEFTDVAGKTGTAQKASPKRGYLPGKFIASFIGFAPLDDPKIACLVLLDEPDPARRYGGDSAAPVFARVVRAIANATPVFDGVLAREIVRIEKNRHKQFRTPNFLRMERWAAVDYARKIGTSVVCWGEEGQVFAQDPDPGVPMEKDETLNLYIRPSQGGKHSDPVPDLRGLPIREAKRRAAAAGLTCVLKGSGIVEKQVPAPGVRSRKFKVTLYCGPKKT